MWPSESLGAYKLHTELIPIERFVKCFTDILRLLYNYSIDIN